MGIPTLGVKDPVQHFIYYLVPQTDEQKKELDEDPNKFMTIVANALNGIVNQHRDVMHDAQCVAIFPYKDGVAITVEMRAHRA